MFRTMKNIVVQKTKIVIIALIKLEDKNDFSCNQHWLTRWAGIYETP